MGWMIQGLNHRRDREIFLFPKMSRLSLGPTQLPIQGVVVALSSGEKWLGHKADHSPPPRAKVKNEWHCTTPPLPLYALTAQTTNTLYLTFTSSYNSPQKGPNHHLKIILL